MAAIKTLKLILIVVIAIIAVIGLLVISAEYLNRKGQRELTRLVSELRPGTSFEKAKLKLGEPSQVYTNPEDVEGFGTTKDQSITANSILFKFFSGRRSIPYRWILIYTDRNTNAVVFADWQDM